jgi:hypothetical protein
MGGGCGGLARELSCWRSTFRRAAFRVASVRSAPRFARSLLTAGFSAFRKDLHPPKSTPAQEPFWEKARGEPGRGIAVCRVSGKFVGFALIFGPQRSPLLAVG